LPSALDAAHIATLGIKEMLRLVESIPPYRWRYMSRCLRHLPKEVLIDTKRQIVCGGLIIAGNEDLPIHMGEAFEARRSGIAPD